MKTKTALLALLIIFSLSVTSFKTGVNHELNKNTSEQLPHSGTKIICVYSFENVTNEMQIEKLKADISLLKEVEGIKSAYKPENGKGQITVIIIEPQRVAENESTFDITQIKKIIISNGLIPLDVIISEENLD